METKEALAQAESRLPPELRAMLQTLVRDYKAAALAQFGQSWMNYSILADLIARGWRKVA